MKIIIIKAIIWILNYLYAGFEGICNGFIFFKNKLFKKSIPEEKKLKKYKILPLLRHKLNDPPYPYPIHDWRDEKLYLKNHSTKEWAWEFLRRNEKYQYDYDRYKLKGHFPELHIIDNERITLEFQKKMSVVYYELDSSYEEIEFIKNLNIYYYDRLVEKKDGTTISLREAIYEKYGLSHSSYNNDLNPRLDLSGNVFFETKTEFIDYIHHDSNLKNQKSLAPINPEHFVMRFNAKEDIPRQISVAKMSLKLLREKHGKSHKGNLVSDKIYIKYIRVLDAISAGMNPKNDFEELVKVIDPDLWKVWTADETGTHPTRYVKDWLIEANKLSNSKYLTLLKK